MSFRIKREIPSEIIRHAILVQMNQKGKTIRGIYESDPAKPGYASQIPHQDNCEWYAIDDLRRLAAIQISAELGLPARDLIGPHRKNNEFHNGVREEIIKLAKDGTIAEWGKKSWVFRLVRLVMPEPVDHTFTPELPPPQYEETGPIWFGEETDMSRVFYTIMTRGSKSNTYKFVLAKTILDYCRDNVSQKIPYKYLADKFLEHYWYQVYRFRMKQDFQKESMPKAISILESVFGDKRNTKNPGIDFERLDKDRKLVARNKILKEIFGHARKSTSHVVPRFQKIPGGDGDTVEYGIFYKYDDDRQEIYLRPEALDFFKRNHAVLSEVVLAEWAKFLEKINSALPNLVSKIEKPTREREPLTKYRDLYYGHTRCCFYCGSVLERGLTHVDHFIPWSYMFSDDAWNLVLACQKCNLKKSDRLPCEEFKNVLVRRNRRYYDSIPELRASLNMLDIGRSWEPEIDNHYTMCGTYGFGKVRLP